MASTTSNPSMAAKAGANLKTLGLPRYANEIDVRLAYRRLVRLEHPDKGGDAARFQAVQDAYDSLQAIFAADAAAKRKAAEAFAAPPVRRGPIVASGAPAQAASGPPLELRQGEDGATVAPSGDLLALGVEALAAVRPLRTLMSIPSDHTSQGDPARAVEYLSAATAFARLSPAQSVPAFVAAVHLARGQAHAALGAWSNARADAERVQAIRPLAVAPAILLAQALAETGQWAAACAAYTATIALAERAGDEAAKAVGRAGLARADAVVRTARCCALLGGHTGPVRCVAWPHDRRPAYTRDSDPSVISPPLVATASDDGTVRVWVAPGGRCVAILRGHSAAITAIQWHPVGGGDHIATASLDATAALWQLPSIDALLARGGPPLVVAPAALLSGHGGGVLDVQWDALGCWIATASVDRTCRVWSAATGALVHGLTPSHGRRVNAVAFSPNGRCLATASDDATARVWDLMGDVGAPGSCLHTLGWESGAVNAVCYTPGGTLIVTASHEPNMGYHRLLVWSAVSGRLCRWYDGHSGIIHGLSWRPKPGNADAAEPDSEVDLATGSLDGTIRLWHIAGGPAGAGAAHRVCDEHRGRVVPRPGYPDVLRAGAIYTVAHAPLPTLLLAAGSLDGRVAWDSIACPHLRPVLMIRLPRSRVRIYDSDDGECLHEWSGHESAVRSLAWSPDGAFLASSSMDGTARIWLAPTKELDGNLSSGVDASGR